MLHCVYVSVLAGSQHTRPPSQRREALGDTENLKMLVTASWGGAEVAVEVDAECRSVAALKRCLQEALPKLDVEAVRLEVCGRPVDDEEVLGLGEGSVIDITATQAALAAATLREEGCDVDFDGFCDAAEGGDLRVCRLYLEADVVWPSGVDTPLHIAVGNDCRELLELLLDAGCDKEALNKRGNTPLNLAVSRENMELTKLLVDAGCDTNARCNGDLPLHHAICRKNTQLTKLLLDAGCDTDAEVHGTHFTTLHLAIYVNSMHLVQLLVDAGCDMEAHIGTCEPPLYYAIRNGSVPLTKLLLDSGCDKDVKADSGKTPLHYAVRGGNFELVKLLLDAGCDMDAKTEYGDTPLNVALSEGEPRLIKLLVDSGCLVEGETAKKLSGFYRARQGGGCCVLC